MNRSTKLWLQIAAFAVTLAALLAIAALALRVSGMSPDSAKAVAIATSMLTAFICVFMGIAGQGPRADSGDSASLSIQDELDLRKAAAQGTRIRLR